MVFSARDPIQQTAAIHRVFSQLDPGRMCPGKVVKPGADFDPNNCMKLSDFVRRGFAGAEFNQGLIHERPLCSQCMPPVTQCNQCIPWLAHAGAHPQDALVKRLAGDYCCYQPELFSEDEARMQAAFTNFLRVGVVIDTTDISSGLRVSTDLHFHIHLCMYVILLIYSDVVSSCAVFGACAGLEVC